MDSCGISGVEVSSLSNLCVLLTIEWLVGGGGRSSRVPVSSGSCCFIPKVSPSVSGIWIGGDKYK